ncbi:unnamed protein product [Adineta ricciae]|uniref:Uncharacterized protein n=1 Tax=Adineta ricciae TaxID=249248 RepID=A0A813ZWA3_ADIRI|nr:unnamed protein product [Adineta ricciae]CAF0905447.1 unnamed protein product [Adineta ricciae]
MVRYPTMRRVTQISVSFLFVLTVLTIFFTFDFLITTAVANKSITDKHRREHLQHLTTSNEILLTKLKNINDSNQERRMRHSKLKSQRVKLARFHKSKTGVKHNQVRKQSKDQRKHPLPTKTNKHSLH